MQQNQAEAALAGGATVLVLDPVDGATASAIIAKAKARQVPVISYDRLISSTRPLSITTCPLTMLQSANCRPTDCSRH